MDTVDLQLTSLAVRIRSTRSGAERFASLLAKTISAQTAIQTLCIELRHPIPYWDIMQSVGTHPALRHLTLACNESPQSSTDEPKVRTLPRGLLNAVQTLDISGEITFLAAILRLGSPEELENVRHSVAAISPDRGRYVSCFKSIGTFRKLRHLRIDSARDIPWECISPVMKCNALETFRASCPEQWKPDARRLSEAELREMSATWPLLKVMDLGEVALDLEHLQVIASTFRNLRTLSASLRFTSTERITSVEERQTVIVNNSLEELVIRSSESSRSTTAPIATMHVLWTIPELAQMTSVEILLVGHEVDHHKYLDLFSSIGRFYGLKTLDVALDTDMIPWSTVRNATGCKALTLFRVSEPDRSMSYGSNHLTETELEWMAGAWPCLQVLDLKQRPWSYEGGKIALDIGHLEFIAAKFRCLRKLCLYVRLVRAPQCCELPSVSPNEALEELDLSVSSADVGSDWLATTFRKWWPKLQAVE
ncbi:hypothetical protein FRB90_005584 [Tulasnella sp. 427]|nr:hypothetical protein FRB90_005584 [Tulasnella sp. 427]